MLEALGRTPMGLHDDGFASGTCAVTARFAASGRIWPPLRAVFVRRTAPRPYSSRFRSHLPSPKRRFSAMPRQPSPPDAPLARPTAAAGRPPICARAASVCAEGGRLIRKRPRFVVRCVDKLTAPGAPPGAHAYDRSLA